MLRAMLKDCLAILKHSGLVKGLGNNPSSTWKIMKHRTTHARARPVIRHDSFCIDWVQNMVKAKKRTDQPLSPRRGQIS